jgi:hypothetical protein
MLAAGYASAQSINPGTAAVQDCGAGVTTCTVTVTPTTGNSVTPFLITSGTISSPSCADNNSNALSAGASESATSVVVYVFYGTAISGATDYKCSWTTSRTAILLFMQYSATGGTLSFNASLSGNAGTASSASASLTVTTQDNNDYNVCAFANGSSNAFTVTVGTSRETGSQGVFRGVLLDNTVATAGSLTCTATLTSALWVGASIEIRLTPSSVAVGFDKKRKLARYGVFSQ